MPTVFSSREFNQDASRAKRAAKSGPVFITDRGKPAHVLLTMEDYRRLTGDGISLAQAVEEAGADFDFDPPRLNGLLIRPADLG